MERNGSATVAAKTASKDWRESFDEDFWPTYPRKVGKEAARRAWNRIGCSGEARTNERKFFNHIMNGLDAWIARHRDTEPEFVPHPSTWLNQQRWEDTDR